MQYYTKSEIARQLGISRTVVTQYLKDFNNDGKDVLEYVKQKYVENNNKKGAGTHSIVKELKNKINNLETLLVEKDKLIFDLNKKIEELSKNKGISTKNKKDDLIGGPITQVSTQTNSKIQLKKGVTTPNMDLLRFVKLSLDAGEINCAEIARKYGAGANRKTVWRYREMIKSGKYNDYLKQLNLL